MVLFRCFVVGWCGYGGTPYSWRGWVHEANERKGKEEGGKWGGVEKITDYARPSKRNGGGCGYDRQR